MSIFEQEVDFLRRLGKRFRTKEAYIGALEDMHNEGLISKKALDEIKRIKNVATVSGRNLKEKPPRPNEEVTHIARRVIEDPCGHNSYYSRSSC